MMSRYNQSYQDTDKGATKPVAHHGEPGIIARLFTSIHKPMIALVALIGSKDNRMLQVCRNDYERLFLWGQDLSVAEGDLDHVLAQASELRVQVLSILSRIGAVILEALHLGPDNMSQVLDKQCNDLQALLEETGAMLRDPAADESTNHSLAPDIVALKVDVTELVEEISDYVDCLFDLSPSLDNPALDIIDYNEGLKRSSGNLSISVPPSKKAHKEGHEELQGQPPMHADDFKRIITPDSQMKSLAHTYDSKPAIASGLRIKRSERRDIFRPAYEGVQDTFLHYERDIKYLDNLPDEFIQVNQCFPVAKETLSYARKNAIWDEYFTETVQPFATSLEKKAKMLQDIFSKVGKQMNDDSNNGSVLDCYRDTLIKLGKSYRVEVLMLGLLKDLFELFTKELLKAEDYMRFNELKEAIDTMSQVKSSVSDTDFRTSGANFSQNVASGGTGNQSYYGGRGHDSRHADANNTVGHDQLQMRPASRSEAGGRPRSREDFQIAIICARPLEYDVVSLLLDKCWDDDDSYGRARGDANSYTNGRMGQYDVVLAILPNIGTVAAAGAAASLRSSYPNLQLAFLVGICGGVPRSGENEIHLGDVIISKSAVQYDLGKQYHKAFVIKDTVNDSLGRPNKNIRSLVASFETEHIRDQLQQKACLYLKDLQSAAAKRRRPQNYQYPGISNDKLFFTAYRHKHRGPQSCNFCDSPTDVFCENAAKTSCIDLGCDETQLVKRTDLEMRGSTGDPEIFVGRIASGNSVMKSGEHRDKIAEEQQVIALEMEGAGVWDEIPCIVVKGVCDYADSHKNDLWQRYAAATAASVMKAVLGRYITTDR